ncbi:MAG TPA: 5-formyltetrahydrofolate cyclo-ligase [Porphyromonadaceae bacterium]|nr:5-formyltetrahydrofolate cyclo-ligase [Porphyromonadaceae bacterium]
MMQEETSSYRSIRDKKRMIREDMRKENALHSTEEREVISQRICSKIESIPLYRCSQHTLFFYPMKYEPDILSLLEKCSKEHSCYLPRVKGEEIEIVLYRGKEYLQKGAFGIYEPMGEPIENLSILDCVLVPAVSFDKEGNRLGHGKGYYDRLLGRLSPSIFIGVCFSWNLSLSIPKEQHDRKVKEVVY